MKYPEKGPDSYQGWARALGVNKTTVWNDHQGKTKFIPEPRLRFYARKYGLSYEELVARWARAAYGVDFSKKVQTEVVLCEHQDPVYEEVAKLLRANLRNEVSHMVRFLEAEHQERIERLKKGQSG